MYRIIERESSSNQRFLDWHLPSLLVYGTITGMRRWVLFIFSILVGIGIGLLFGWIIQPTKYNNTTLHTLRMDYKTDYVLMAAETYTLDHNPAAATHRLANLESGSALEILRQAILYAEQAGYIDQDLQKLHNLQSALSAAASPTAVPAP